MIITAVLTHTCSVTNSIIMLVYPETQLSTFNLPCQHLPGKPKRQTEARENPATIKGRHRMDIGLSHHTRTTDQYTAPRGWPRPAVVYRGEQSINGDEENCANPWIKAA